MARRVQAAAFHDMEGKKIFFQQGAVGEHRSMVVDGPDSKESRLEGREAAARETVRATYSVPGQIGACAGQRSATAKKRGDERFGEKEVAKRVASRMRWQGIDA